MNPTPYLTFKGNCREAMETYARIFGGTIDMMMRADEAPPGAVDALPPEKAGWVMHASLVLGDGMLMGSDDIMGDTQPMAGCSVMMVLPEAARGAEVFAALAEGGEVRMDYQSTFWSAGFGTLRDRFGVNWMISTDEAPEG